MKEAFETWAPREIQRLREAADVLQLALNRFVAAQERKPGVAPASLNNAQGRRSKHDIVFEIFAQASSVKPITYDDMERLAADAGIPLTRNSLRTAVYSQKKLGLVRSGADGYVWLSPQTETASSDQEDAVS